MVSTAVKNQPSNRASRDCTARTHRSVSECMAPSIAGPRHRLQRENDITLGPVAPPGWCDRRKNPFGPAPRHFRLPNVRDFGPFLEFPNCFVSGALGNGRYALSLDRVVVAGMGNGVWIDHDARLERKETR
ncbi:hypothetical protein Aglo03_43520 [Actinokineospora globicatena]|uniref:Uncharacterized protein n=1 Tax=Actinokineospora globicatena TaxID=103729 RepID=A0A9W6QP23_9PSEU|nr:hypothetical protein Aglo03_43520 [Actinokineospora globicatena]